ncbi:uncharacterized protein EKO05_0001542 [Ascochyta rabiei]|uniref:uncharacterized protein n=1 Tax=Didymella rabiei TaxID=5454 RepID=UPI0021FB0F8A|nr:uncharacterized protein EKO05_0001542 [Ascochyta rabiei]UPX10907.1 hypothetical protein EKO05_0001542 [Ascochyta rabiei]
MARSARKRISYVLPLANSAGGHRLGVNGLAVDPQSSTLYSGGRDGVICAWDLGLDLNHAAAAAAADADDELDPFADSHATDDKPPPTQFRSQVQAHTHWINDLVLASNSAALVSASSDITVKIWRPAAYEAMPPETIGLHTDYVKRVASPGQHENWIASGGLDRKISLWDLNGGGRRLEIHVGEDDNASAKGSVYALAATPTILASGGPESVVRVWDPRTGKRITKFVGHTDNVRDILVAQDGETILTASSDQTVKVWSMTAGRCMHTLTMHNDSVWSLFSEDPQLSVFYSSDRSGTIAKTDVRHCAEWDDGLSVAVCQEHEGVGRVVSAGDYIWTATSSSSINRWSNVDTSAEVELPDSYRWHGNSVPTTRSRYPSPPASGPSTNGATPKIPGKALLRLSNTAPYPQLFAKDPDTSTLASTRKPAEVLTTAEHTGIVPVRSAPDFCIEGQNGLMKHHLLNDRRRVLTMDTAGECMLWDLLQCAPIKSFGKRHMEDVLPEVNTQESVAHWCAVDTRIGTLTCVLEENYCFDAEMYADELQLEEQIDFREDHRINLGKWILRYLFSNFIDEEIKRDEVFRAKLLQEKQQEAQTVRPTTIEMPNVGVNGWNASGPASASTLKGNGFHFPHTPGMGIGLATPQLPSSNAGRAPHHNAYLTPTTEDGNQLEPTKSQRSSTQDGQDYFGQGASTNGNGNGNGNAKPAEATTETKETKEETVSSPTLEDTPSKKGKGMFGKKFNMGFSKKMFATGTAIAAEAPKPAVDEKAEDSDSRSTKTDEKTFEDNFFGSIQRIRHGYGEVLTSGTTDLVSAIAPSLPSDTPVLKPPAMTTILIQEDRPGSGGVADLFEGKVGTLALQADLIEKVAPMWLGEVLLRNQLPPKDIVKVSFVLEPYQNSLPAISTDGNNRLNANRMLRARKILGYVAERIEPAPTKEEQETAEAEEDTALRPHEYLELYCNGQLIAPTMTLASIRAHVWRGGGDVVLHYKANGRKEIKQHPQHPGLPFAVQQGGLSSGLGSSNASEGKPSSEAGRSQHSSQGDRNAAFGP